MLRASLKDGAVNSYMLQHYFEFSKAIYMCFIL